MNRTKLDEQLEKGLEDFIRNWQVSLPVFLGVIGYLIYQNWERIAPDLPIAAIFTVSAAALRFAIGGFAILALLLISRLIWIYRYNSETFKYLQILPNSGDEIDPATLGEMIRRIHGARRRSIRRLIYGKEWFTFLIHYRKTEKRGNQYVFYIGAPADRIGSVQRHMSALYAKAEFYPADDIVFPGHKAESGRLMMRRVREESTLSLARFKKDRLPAVLAVMAPDSWIQIAFSADSERKLKKRIIEAESKVKAGKGYRERNAFDREEEKSFKTRFYGNEVSFQVVLSVASENRRMSVIREMATALEEVLHDVNRLSFWRLPGMIRRYPFTHPYRMVWTGSELANILHLPSFTGSGVAERIAHEIPHSKQGTRLLPKNVLASKYGYHFGDLVHPLLEGRKVLIEPNALSKHFGLTGITGSGKSTVLNTIFRSFIDYSLANERAPGFSFIDPKKETATIVLNQLMKRELDGMAVDWSKVHWISFKDAKNPPAMNLLYRMPGVDDNVLTDQIMRIIRESNPNQAMQAERLLKKCIQTLLADKDKTHTILGIKPLLLKYPFRQAILARLRKDPANYEILDFWETEADDLIPASGQAILTRMDTFSSNPFLRRIFGQTDFNFPIREWMDQGHMVFYDFSGMGEEEVALIGGYLSYLYYRIADTRPDRSLLHQFVIDEAQRVHASILPEIIAEMRSKGLSLGISTQIIEGLDPELRKKLVNVAGNMFVCKQGEAGAKLAANAFRTPGANGKDIEVYSEAYLKNLPTRTCVIKTEDQGETVFAVSKVPYLDRYLPNGKIAKFSEEDSIEIEQSNQWTYAKAKELERKNGKPQAEIDAEIRAYLNDEEPEREKIIQPEREEIKLVPRETMERVKLLKE